VASFRIKSCGGRYDSADRFVLKRKTGTTEHTDGTEGLHRRSSVASVFSVVAVPSSDQPVGAVIRLVRFHQPGTEEDRPSSSGDR